MTAPATILLTSSESGERLDQFLAREIPQISRSRARDLIVSGRVLIDGQISRPSQKLPAGRLIEVAIPPPEPTTLIPEDIAFDIVYEDDDLVVVDKPAGISVHPGPGHREHTLVHGLLARFPALPGINGSLRPGIVHRLDLDTSGLLMVAKSDAGFASLTSQFADRTIKKGYLSLLKGSLGQPSGTIDAPIGRDPLQRQQMAVERRGRPSRTRYVQIERWDQYSLVLAMPVTGRTHQIRVHFSASGHPVAGDHLYGGGVPFLRRQFLHATFLRFCRPRDGEFVQVSSPLPLDLRSALGIVSGCEGNGGELRKLVGWLVQLSEKHFCNEPS